MNSRELVYILLRSLNSYLPTPKGSLTGRASGLEDENSRWTSCGRCQALGRVTGGGEHAQPCPVCREARRKKRPAPLEHGCRECLSCSGRGYRRRRKKAGLYVEEAHDPYLILQRSTADAYGARQAEDQHRLDLVARARRVERRLADEEAEREQRWDRISPESWEWVRDGLRRRGSYAQLDSALRWLADLEPLLYRVLVSVEVNAEPIEVTTDLRVLVLDRAVEMLAGRMVLAGAIRVPSWLLAEHVERRSRELLGDGLSCAEVALALGVSETKVKQVRRGMDDRARLVAA